jgi:hypothetical protein
MFKGILTWLGLRKPEPVDPYAGLHYPVVKRVVDVIVPRADRWWADAVFTGLSLDQGCYYWHMPHKTTIVLQTNVAPEIVAELIEDCTDFRCDRYNDSAFINISQPPMTWTPSPRITIEVRKLPIGA